MKLIKINPNILITQIIENFEKNNCDVFVIIVDLKSFDFNNIISKYQVLFKNISDDTSLFKKLSMYYLSNFVPKTDIQIKTNKFGKPFIDNSKIMFNISHSVDKYVIAISQNNNVGVDIEKINFNKRVLQLAHRFFSINEYNHLCTLQSDVLIETFYEMWTLKESLVKCLGYQMFNNMDKIDTINHLWSIGTGSVFSNVDELFYANLSIDKMYKSSISSEKPIKDLNIYYQL